MMSPIILFVYDRPEHTTRTLEALKKNPEAKKSILYIYCDGPKPNTDELTLERINRTHEIVDNATGYKETKVIKSAQNLGLAASIVKGVTEVVNRHGTVIVLEDDLIVSPNFLAFMNNALQHYNHDNQVACISGYIYPVEQSLPDTFFLKGADCWGWATWKKAWSHYEPDGVKLLTKILSTNQSHEFDFFGSYPYTRILQEQIEGKNDSWAVRWYASAFLENMLCLYPGKSLLYNIGFDGSGTHSGDQPVFKIERFPESTSIQRIPLIEDIQAKRKISNFFSRGENASVSLMKRIAGKILNKVRSYKARRNQDISDIWKGDYQNWEEATNDSRGYDSDIILKTCSEALVKVRNGEAVYERDGVVFNEVQYSWPVLSSLLRLFSEEKKLSVLDFGGSLGSSYFQNRNILQSIGQYEWSIVEQSDFVAHGRDVFEDDCLQFFETVEDCFEHRKPNVLLLSSVLQYMSEPFAWVSKFLNLNLSYILVDRTAFNETGRDILTVQHVPDEIYQATYPSWFFDLQKFKSYFEANYELTSQFDNGFTQSTRINEGIDVFWNGLIYKRK